MAAPSPLRNWRPRVLEIKRFPARDLLAFGEHDVERSYPWHTGDALTLDRGENVIGAVPFRLAEFRGRFERRVNDAGVC
jgi:hypothetical protein